MTEWHRGVLKPPIPLDAQPHVIKALEDYMSENARLRERGEDLALLAEAINKTVDNQCLAFAVRKMREALKPQDGEGM